MIAQGSRKRTRVSEQSSSGAHQPIAKKWRRDPMVCDDHVGIVFTTHALLLEISFFLHPWQGRILSLCRATEVCRQENLSFVKQRKNELERELELRRKHELELQRNTMLLVATIVRP